MAADREEEERGDEEPIQYHHDFSTEEIDMMLYEWDEAVDPVIEYHYMKPEWQTPDAIVGKKPSSPMTPIPKPKKQQDIQKYAKDTGTRTIVDLNKDAPPDEKTVFLDIDNIQTAVVVEFYVPWCAHCRHLKGHYVSLAQEVTRRSIAIPVRFYAISCQLYTEVCRGYNITGFPVVFGYGLGMDIKQRGIELNKDGTTMTAELVAHYLRLSLAHENKDLSMQKFNSAEARRAYEAKQVKDAEEAARQKRSWQMHKSSLNERYHNAATSLALILKTGIFLEQSDSLDDKRVLALKEFLELADWALPQAWHVRTGMVQDVLGGMASFVEGGPSALNGMVQQYQSMQTENGLWGDLFTPKALGDKTGLGADVPHHTKQQTDLEAVYWKNVRWTDSCTHNERAMGFTCGLWNLLHILSIGTSVPIHRAYGFQSGYLTAPSEVAEVVKRFVTNFFTCDVCRWNFQSMYDRCGHDRCNRLNDTMPELIDTDEREQEQIGREFAIWLWEAHNSINVRLMREAAAREDRNVTITEQLAAVFPQRDTCSKCWVDETMRTYDKNEVYAFLRRSYWPMIESSEVNFQRVVRGRLPRHTKVMRTVESWWFVVGPLGILLAALTRRFLERKANLDRKNV